MAARLLQFANYSPTQGEFALLSAEFPGRGTHVVGVVLLDKSTDTLHTRLRRDWELIANEEDVEVVAAMERQLQIYADETGGEKVFELLEENASAALRISDREAVSTRDFESTLNDLYRRHVPSEILHFRTHLPRFSLAVAAGPFLTNPEDVQAEEWVEAPADLKLDEDMFVARIQGRSMEPRIPDNSLCVFRRNVVGSRHGRLVLVRNSELADDNRYTVKRYKSEKVFTEDGFTQNRIRLESLNPDYPSWDLDPEQNKYQVVAEFVRVL